MKTSPPRFTLASVSRGMGKHQGIRTSFSFHCCFTYAIFHPLSATWLYHAHTNSFDILSRFFAQLPHRSLLAMSKQWLIDSTWQKVHEDFDLVLLFGEHGARFLETLGARRCLHPLAVAMSILASLAALANGAGVRIWSDPSPLCVAVVLINAAQSRKSQTTTLVREIGVVLDEVSHARERDQMLKDAADPNDVKHEVLPSAVLEGFTPEARRSLRICFPWK